MSGSEQPMNVKNLIDELEKQNPEAELLSIGDGEWWPALVKRVGRIKRIRGAASVKTFTLKSPDGETIRVRNLRAWCKENENRFEDYRQGSKMPLWMRAHKGISHLPAQQRPRRKPPTWNGWRVVKIEE